MKRRAASSATASVADDQAHFAAAYAQIAGISVGKYLVIEGVRFAYGHEQVLAAGAQQCRLTPAYRPQHGERRRAGHRSHGPGLSATGSSGMQMRVPESTHPSFLATLLGADAILALHLNILWPWRIPTPAATASTLGEYRW